jgi:hypothetical protein
MNAFNERNDLNLPSEMQLFHQGVLKDARITTLTHLHIDACMPERIRFGL